MEKEEVELLPAGLVTCLLQNQEMRILKISPQRLTIRVAEKIKDKPELKISFYKFNEYKYIEMIIDDYEICEEIKDEFYYTYIFNIVNDLYAKNVRIITKDYTKYVMLKNYGEDNEYSEEMVGYPAELDYDFYDYFSNQKRDWLWKIKSQANNSKCVNNFELAINLDNDTLYRRYLEKDLNSFKEEYLNDNYIENNKTFKKDISRIYIGNEFCHNLFPETNILMKMLNKAYDENIDITLSFTYMRECYIEKTKNTLDEVYKWCTQKSKTIEIIINDWGILKLIEDKKQYFKPILGVLLNKRKKDPRYEYKKGYAENKVLMSQNNLNSKIVSEFLKTYNIDRYEYESCGYKMSIAEGKHSLHMPFYVTNTSQYCPLHAMCTSMDRGNQKLVANCPKYCKDYIFSYPKHLKMVGRYNSLFSFDDTLIKNPERIQEYIDNGIDRIVLNFI